MKYVVFDSGSPVPLSASESKIAYFPRVVDIEHPFKSYFMRPAYELFKCSLDEIPAYPDAVSLSKLDSKSVDYLGKLNGFLEKWSNTLALNEMPSSFLPFGPFRFRELSADVVDKSVRKSKITDDLLYNVILDTMLLSESRKSEFMSLLTVAERETLHFASIENSDWLEICVFEQGSGFQGHIPMIAQQDKFGLTRTSNIKGFIDSVTVPKQVRLFRIFGHSSIFIESNLLNELYTRGFIAESTLERCVYKVDARKVV